MRRLYHVLPLRAGGGSDVIAGKSQLGMLHSCDKAHTPPASANTTRLINALVYGDGDVTEEKRDDFWEVARLLSFANSDLMKLIKL